MQKAQNNNSAMYTLLYNKYLSALILIIYLISIFFNSDELFWNLEKMDLLYNKIQLDKKYFMFWRLFILNRSENPFILYIVSLVQPTLEVEDPALQPHPPPASSS